MRTNEWISLIENLTTRPEMWVGRADYELIAAYLNGYDHACDGALLIGFHEWLTMRYGRGHNLAWPFLIRYETLGYPSESCDSIGSNDEALLKSLRELLTEFLRYRQEIGLRNHFYDHGRWLRQFEWFDEKRERFGSSSGPQRSEE